MNRRNLFRVALGAVAAALPIKATANTPDSLSGITLEWGESSFFNDRDAGWNDASLTFIHATPDEEIAYFNAGDPKRHFTIVNDMDASGDVMRWRIEYDDGEVREWQSPLIGIGAWRAD